MPGRDGTGPMGFGSMTGRGRGFCKEADAVGNIAGLGMGFGCRRRRGYGSGKYLQWDLVSPEAKKELLQKQKELFQKQIEEVDKQLENL